jgi:glycosidase
MYERRKEVQRGIITSHGEASGHFVTFLDNHDMRERFFYVDPLDPDRWNDQITMATACLFSLQGIPCVYYGTEQGLHGRGTSDQAVREALWGKDNPFDQSHEFYTAIREVARVRSEQPALRYGRQYFRAISGNGVEFGLSPFPGGVLAFSRILNETEVVVLANTDSGQPFEGEVIVDAFLNREDATYAILYSNKSNPRQPGKVMTKAPGSVEIREPDERVTKGPARALRISLQPMEVQILRRAGAS